VTSPERPATPQHVERQLWLARHGETEWSRSGQHTSRTDLPLTEIGRAQATELGARLGARPFAMVLTSPLARASDTARIAGFGDRLVVDDDLREWDYGEFEGRRTDEIRVEFPGWSIWQGPWRGGETIDQVAERADRVITRVRAIDGDVLAFSHGHLLRVLAARWLGREPEAGDMLALSTGSISVLGWEREEPVVERWNETCT
jgi:broad specificity phosphatase PhoE